MSGVSVVMPVWNEAGAIGATLAAIARVRGVGEVVVIDGGSADDTANIARGAGARVLTASRGRGAQLAAGAHAANGEVLWFVHADTKPPECAAECIVEALADPDVVAGNFTLHFDGGTRAARSLTRAYPWFRLLGLCYGDSGVFTRRADYDAVGGFRPYPIFEDLDLVSRLKKRGRFVRLDCALTTSSRRFEGRSFTWTFARWTCMQCLYWAGVDPCTIGRMYAPIRERGAAPAAQKRAAR